MRPTLDPTARNERLTATTATVLLVLLAVEGFTILSVRQMLSVHIVVGLLLIPPVALKLASTGYRFLRYYSGVPAYRRKGPPALALRLLAPGVVVTSLALFVTGGALLLAGPPSGRLVLLHKVSFIAWLALMTAHVLGHLLEVPRLALPDWRRHGGREAALAGAGTRVSILAASVLAGAGLALACVSLAGPWLSSTSGG